MLSLTLDAASKKTFPWPLGETLGLTLYVAQENAFVNTIYKSWHFFYGTSLLHCATVASRPSPSHRLILASLEGAGFQEAPLQVRTPEAVPLRKGRGGSGEPGEE